MTRQSDKPGASGRYDPVATIIHPEGAPVRSFTRCDGALSSIEAKLAGRLRILDAAKLAVLPATAAQAARAAAAAAATGVEASCAIEGIIVANAERIIAGTSPPRTLAEQQLAGCRDVYRYLAEDDWRPLNVGLIVHLHRLLFGHTDMVGGSFKQSDNVVVDRQADGGFEVRFHPVAAKETTFYVAELISRFRAATAVHPILRVAVFVLDFLVIHPFDDGNGRVTRALTNALLVDAGYDVVRYVSHEQIIVESADDYYRALVESTRGWQEDKADLRPWIEYFVDVLAVAYGISDRG